jgi:alpha-glucosidase (family GH31 glycosyl hydrolase)
MEYDFPGEGYHNIKDQFMLGPDVLVAPVLQHGATSRMVTLPKGEWTWKGKTFSGGNRIEVAADLNELPVFKRK